MAKDTTTTGKTQRIAVNALALFVRMFVVMVVNLYAVRLILAGLGELDYGIYNTIASVVTISACVVSTLSVAIQRFYSVALGQQDLGELTKVFSASVNVIVALLVVIIIFFETVGLWFVHTQLVIPAERMSAALCVYQYGLATLSLSFLQVPFVAALFAYEYMDVYALISLMECLLRLGVAWLLGIVGFDHLEFYAFGLLLTAVLVCAIYATATFKRCPECRYIRVRDCKLYRCLLAFSGWTLYGSLSNIGLIQGSIILLNIFFGPILVASFGIAQQVNAAFNALSSAMVQAFRPAMIKAYAEARIDYLNTLFVACNKFVIYIMSAVAIPIFLEMDTILRLWLKTMSETTVLFTRLIILYIVCAALHHPITIVMQAIGRIREYHLCVETICLLSVPLTWFLFLLGTPSYTVFLSMISLCLLAQIARVVCIKRYYESFSLRQYLMGIYLPSVVIIAIVAAFIYLLHISVHSALARLCVLGLASPALVFVLAFFVGFSSEERQLVVSILPTRKYLGK